MAEIDYFLISQSAINFQECDGNVETFLWSMRSRKWSHGSVRSTKGGYGTRKGRTSLK